MKEPHKNIFALVKLIMTNEKHFTCFSATRFDSKYLPVDESNITLKTSQMSSNRFPARCVVFAVVPVLQEKNISVNIKCDLLIVVKIWMLTLWFSSLETRQAYE